DRNKVVARGNGGSGIKDAVLETRQSGSPRKGLWRAMQVGLLIVLAIYFFSQGVAYIQADERNTFQGTGCIAANPTDQSSIINYMQRSRMHYAWATGWLGDPITFKTDGALLVTELHGRIQANSNAVLHADRPGIFFLVPHDDAHPALLKALDARNVTYHIQRFYSEPGVDLLLVTPLNHTVSPLDPAFNNLFQLVFKGCLTQ
ncbi:MAG TPA: hypothetical protein VE843_06510, partial [Ktedonobacteraceae bacterium]|nr:hypothetical protein [Ktedonobacteraceae bacterium]